MTSKNIVLSLSLFIVAQALAAKSDVDKSRDHPLISRYLNSNIIQYTQTDFDEYSLGVGPMDNKLYVPKTKSIEGKTTTIIYATETNKTTVLKVYRNFESTLKKE